MSYEHFTKQLKDGEEIIRIVKRYPLAYAVPLFVGTVLILVPFFFLYPLLRAGSWGLLLWVVLLVAAILYAARQTYIYFFNILIVTNQRLIDVDQKGFFSRSVSEMTYEKIQDIRYHVKGPLQTLFHYGSIVIQSAGSESNIKIESIYHPEGVQEDIVKLQEEVRRKGEDTQRHELSAQELIAIIQHAKSGMSQEEVDSLLRAMKEKPDDDHEELQ